MIRRGIKDGGRLAATALAAVLVLSLVGDRGRAATVPAVIQGQDPLEVLELKVRPNVMIVLDSSGSMQWTLDPNHRAPGDPLSATGVGDPVNSGDHPRSKLFQAKQVLKTIVQDNEDQASFLFGQYTQGAGPTMQNRNATSSSTSGQNRFMYWTSEDLSPSMTANELSVERASGDPGGSNRGLQSWQWIEDDWDTLHFSTCQATVPAGFYATGASLATALQNAMNATSCGSSYTVTYDTGTGQFHFNTGINWSATATDTIVQALGGQSDWNSSRSPYTLLFREDTPPSDDGTYGTNSWGLTFHNTFDEEIPPGSGNLVINYQLRAAKFFNGEIVKVTATGEVCDVIPATAAERTNPPTLILQEVAAGCGADVGNPVTFTWAGAFYTGGSGFCDGFRTRVDLVPCDLQSPPAPTQFATIGPWLDNEAPLDTDGSIVGYSETMDGSWDTATYPAGTDGGIKSWGSTPIAASLQDIQGIFSNLWNDGQTGTTNMADPPPYQLDAIRNHVDPKEKTIVLFITDGDDTCAGSGDSAARTAASRAEQLYNPITVGEPASSVQTYVIGYGGGATGSRLNWIAWGGSGLGQGNPGQPDVNWGSDSNAALANARAQCTTCEDAFIAPDASTLAATLQGLIDQGASEGEFTAQQSITESVFEYVDVAGPKYDARFAKARYDAIVPTQIISSFTLPGFRGQVKAYQNDGFGNAVLKWSAGHVLWNLVSGGMNGCDTTATQAAVGECSFQQLHGDEDAATIGTSSDAAIRRRIYTTDRNGVYDFDPDTLMAGTASNRPSLWPPEATLAPRDYTSEGTLDVAMGLPPNSSADPAGEFTTLQDLFQACLGGDRPAGCTDASALVRMQAARREAREMILAFMAGAERVMDPSTAGPKRAPATAPSVGAILYKARSWVLGDSEFATAAVVTQPLKAEPDATQWVSEYRLFRDGAGPHPRGNSDVMIRQGFGLRDPDLDPDLDVDEDDGNASLKPVMTVVYVPANDMLHAFRAGPCYSPSTSGSPPDCVGSNSPEDGGEELWGFVPFDQLGALQLRFIHEPQGRDNHVYMLARGVRFADVFVPYIGLAAGATESVTVNGEAQEIQGVWRRVLYVLRGIGGKHVTALDVTAPGPYTAAALSTEGPIPLWSRGNPDTDDGTGSGTDNGTTADRDAYGRMGETWSLPAVAYVDKTAFYETDRRPDGVDYVLFMGSGYGDTPDEGSTFYTLDALSGDVIAAVDVEVAASAIGLDRALDAVDADGECPDGLLCHQNALVANPVGFNPANFQPLKTVHPAEREVTRVYIGDLHGRLWKFLAAEPDVAIPMADLGEDQPVATAASLLGMPPYPNTPLPYVFVTSGNDQRVEGPFKVFAFLDGASSDVDVPATFTAGTTVDGVTPYNETELLFVRPFDQGDPEADCGYTEEAFFRGTVQPATGFECGVLTGGVCQDILGRVFFAGTRLSLPNTKYAPVTPLACGGGDYPCRSQFDSIIYALGAETGVAAYDLNSAGDDAYRVFRDSRIAAIGMQADPDPTRGGSRFTADEGLVKAGPPEPPPPPGVPPSSVAANVLMVREPGEPPPSVRYGSTVCR